MSSENFVNGFTKIGLQIFFSSGAMLRISFLSVGMTPPDFGSSLEEMVPPVIIIATFGNCWGFDVSVFWGFGGFVSLRWWVSRILAVSISDSLIPML